MRKKKKYACACCGNKVFNKPPENYEICPVCGWEKDPVQEAEPDFAGGANKLSLNETRKNYIEMEINNEQEE